MAQQYLNDGEEEKVRSQPVHEPEHTETPQEDVSTEAASSRTDEPTVTKAASRRQRRDKNGDEAERRATGAQEDSASSSEEDDLRKLEELGFTRDEATRLIDVADRSTNSPEHKRLQFAKWLVEQGVLDEFSLRD
jgi:hypothetical protein